MTEAEAINWVRTALKGERITYHSGHLAYDREMRRDGVAINNTANLFSSWQRFGGVALTQRRIGPNDWAYIAERSGAPASAFINVHAIGLSPAE